MRSNRHRVGGKVEDAPDPCDDRRQSPEIWEADDGLEAIPLRRFDDQHTVFAADRNRASVTVARYGFHARDGSGVQESQDGAPVIGQPVAEPDADRASRLDGLLRHVGAAQRIWWPPVELLKGLIEAANAAKARGGGNLGHWQPGVLD